MGHQIVKQPNGLYAVWSSVVDDFIIVDATPEDIIQHRIERMNEEIRKDVTDTIATLEKGGKPYHQMTRTFDECVAWIREFHGSNCESLQMLGLAPSPSEPSSGAEPQEGE